jgi:pimeloyl-ACP methyl ester carboxylesterase
VRNVTQKHFLMEAACAIGTPNAGSIARRGLDFTKRHYLFYLGARTSLSMLCELGDLHIYYETCGQGKPVLAIHGFGIDHHVMTGCLEPIFSNRAGWKRIYLDLPGMGHTRAPRWLNNADQMLDALTEFCENVIPEDKFLVAGESYGGYLARGLVRSLPERLYGVLLICPVIIADRSQRDLPARQVFVRDEPFLRNIAASDQKRLFERVLVVQDKRRWHRFTQDIIPGINAKNDVFLKRFEDRGYSFSFDVGQLPHPFDQPSLILAGRQDTSVGYLDSLKIVANYSHGTFAILDRAGHGLEVEQETVFNCLVNEWLDRVEEAQRS